MTIIIDKEFEAMIPPLTAEELPELTESLKADGCRDALVLWGDILIDGHNRYRICTEAGIPYMTVSIELKDRDAAKAWIVTNQLARRNLEAYQRAKLALLREGIYRDQAKAGQGRRTDLTSSSTEEKVIRDSETDTRLAKEAGVGRATIHRVRVIEREAPEEVKAALAEGKTSITAEYEKLTNPSKQPRQRQLDINRYVSTAALQVEMIMPGLDFVDSRLGDLDLEKVDGWIKSIESGIRDLRELVLTLRRAQNPNPSPVESTGSHEATGPCVAMLHADNTIMQLEKIPPNDIERTAALERVLAWVTTKMKEYDEKASSRQRGKRGAE